MQQIRFLRSFWLFALAAWLTSGSFGIAKTLSWTPSPDAGTVQVLTNGSFESSVTGWTTTGNQFLESGASYAAPDGNTVMSFNGNSTSDSQPNAVLLQSFATTVGTTYTLAFDMGVIGSQPAEQRIQVTVDGAGNLLSQTVSKTNAGGTTAQWSAMSYTFVADSTTTTLTFRDVSAVTAGTDALLDNVRVTKSASNVLGYVIRYGTSSGIYTTTLDVGNVTSVLIPDPPAGVTYYAVVTAYTIASIESLPSPEVSFTGSGSTVSANADLSALGLNAGTLSPTFGSGTTSYTASVPNTTASITITPTVAQTNATVKVNGVTVPSGTASPAIDLAVGSNTITTVVTAQDGITTKAYTLAVTRAASNNASLAALLPSAGTLSPTFASGTTSYTASVPNTTTAITVTPTVAQANATVKVNGVTVPSGTASPAINLAVGSNTITTVVTAQDGTTTKTYAMAVTRAPSNNANLTSLVASAGTLSPAFASGTTSYTASVPNTTAAITVTPAVAQANATVKVNGVTVPSGTASPAINLAVGSNTITTVVTAQDGTTTKTYAMVVTRTPSNNADLTSLVASAGTLSPAFASGTTSYTATVPITTTSITVTPTVAQTNATVKVNGSTVVSGTPSPAITIATGGTTITTVVTAQDGTTRTYTLTVSQEIPSDLAGNYNGLSTPTSSSTNTARHVGLGIVTVSATGAFTGKITLGGSSTAVAFSGTFGTGNGATFNPSATTTLSIPRAGLPTLSLALNLDRQVPVTSRISGTLTDSTGTIVSTLGLDRSLYTDAASPVAPLTNVPTSLLDPAKEKGAYTAVFQARTPAQVGLAATAFPQGDGWATLTVQPTGAVSVTGKLSDGQAFTYSSYLSKNNVLPLYLTPYAGAGTVFGSLTFRDMPAQSDVDGIGAKWFKPANSKDSSYREGWPNGIQTDFLGSKFVSPLMTGLTPLGNDPVPSPTVNGNFMVTDGGLLTALTNDLSISTASRATVLDPAAGGTAAPSLTVTLSSSGNVSGSFTHPTWNATPIFAGVVLQKTRTAGGYFLAKRSTNSTLQSGSATISATTAAPAAIAAN